MFGKGVDQSANIGEFARDRKMRRGAIAMVATSALGLTVGGHIIPMKQAIIARTNAVENAAADDGFMNTEAVTANPDAETLTLYVQLGSCQLAATVSVEGRGQTVDVTDYQMNVYSNTESYETGLGNMQAEPVKLNVADYDELIAMYPDPCSEVHSV